MSHDMLNKEWERGAYEMPEEEVSVMDWRQKECTNCVHVKN